MNWIRFFVYRPILTITLYIFLLISGLASMLSLSIESESSINRQEIQVSVAYSSSIDAVLNSVAKPMEKQFLSIPGLDLLKSDVTNNNIQFTLVFSQNSDINNNLIRVQSAIADAKSEIPENAIVTIPPAKEENTKIMSITFNSDHKTIDEINNFITKFKSLFETTDGVSSVIIGNDESNDIFNILINPAEMYSRNLAFHDIVENLKSFYIQGGSSDITVGNNSIALEIGYDNTDNLTKHPILTNTNSSIYLHEIANVNKYLSDDHTSSYRLNNKNVVTLIVFKKQDANMISVCRTIRNKFNKIKDICNKNNINADIVQDNSIFIQNGINSIYHTIIESIILVSIVISLFLRSFRLSIIPIIAIPLSIMPTFILMRFFSISINIYSLFGISIGIGLVVDDAIVVVETIYTEAKNGKSKINAILYGLKNIMISILAMTIVLVVVYLPILTSRDPYIKPFFDFAFVISTSVLFSGLVSITITPVLYNLIIKENFEDTKNKKCFMESIERIYLNLLCFLISNRYLFFYLFTTITTILIVLLLKVIKYEDEVNVDRGNLSYSYNYKTDNNLDVNYVDKKLSEIYNNISKLQIYDDINYVITSVNQNDPMRNYIEILLKPHSQRKFSLKTIEEQIKDTIEKDPSDIYVYHSNNSNSSKKLVHVDIQCYDDGIDSKEIVRIVGNFEPISSLIEEFYTIDVRPRNCYLLTINKDICKLYNVSPYHICNALTSIKKGKFFRESVNNQINKISIGIQCDHQEEQLSKILDIPIRGYVEDKSNVYPLRTFAYVKNIKQMSKYHRILGNPGMSFSMILKPGYSTEDMYQAIQKLNSEYGDILYTEINIFDLRKMNSFKTISFMVFLSIIFVYLILSAVLESFIKPIMILSVVPASSIGGLILLYLFNLKINTVSLIGMITLIGLITKHGIMLIDKVSQLEIENFNVEPDIQILDACLARLQPILMTTGCMILGAIPLIIKTKVEFIEYKMPIGLVIIGGTGIGTIIVLFVLPIYYVLLKEIFYDKKLVTPNRYIYIINNKLREKYS